jgi:vitamin B12 transporter
MKNGIPGFGHVGRVRGFFLSKQGDYLMNQWLLIFLFAFAAHALAQDSNENQYQLEELVVTATKVETPAKEVGSSITVVTSKQIAEQQKSTVLEVLRSVPSLDVVQSGGMGRTASVYMRGAKAEHTLVLIDGVEMNDPISAGRSVNFADLTVDNIERIEILRGPQSTIYGSDAMGGVIHIITKTGKGKANGSFSLEGGSFNSLREAGSVNGGADRIQYSLGFSRQDTDGISAIKGPNYEKDGYGNTATSGKLSVKPFQNFTIEAIYRRTQSKADLDNAEDDDPNYTNANTSNFLRTQAKLALFNAKWDQQFGFSLSDIERSNRNDVDIAHPDSSSLSSFNGRMYKFDWQNNFDIHRTNALTLGLETEEEKGKSDNSSQSAYGLNTSAFIEKSARTTGFYAQDQMKFWNAWFTTIGIRVDRHTNSETQATYRLASAYVFESIGTKIKGSYGTGFKSPSLYQLYSSYGDENLKSEKSAGWDVGLEQSLRGERIKADFTYFNNEFENMVDYNRATYRYSNIAKAKSHGVELSAFLHAAELLTIGGSYTYTKAIDKGTGLGLLRRAKNKFGIDANYQVGRNGNINLNLIYVGKRADTNYATRPASRLTMPGYAVINMAASFDLTKKFQIIGRIDNLFNRQYEEVAGFGTPGISAFGGIKTSF